MATITLDYNEQVKRKIENHRLSIRKKSGLEEALEDVANGRLTTIHTPKNRKIQ